MSRPCCDAYMAGDAPMCRECAALLASDAFSGVDARQEPEAITREDSDALLDLIAAEKSSGYRDRSFGG